MSDRILVEVFGIRNQSSGGSSGCGCSGGCCGTSKTMGESYDEFVQFLQSCQLRNRIDIRFVDVLMEDMDPYDYAMKAMDHGYGLPLTAINKKVLFYGGISERTIYNELRKLVLCNP